MRPALAWILNGLFLAGAQGTAHAHGCAIRTTPTTTVGASASFALDCDPALATQVSWEFGDGAVLEPAMRTNVAHVYAAPGSYNVFARIEGEDIPASTLITVLNAVSAVAPTRSGTLLLDRGGRRLWNVNVDNHSVTVIDAITHARIKEIPVGRAPRTLAQDGQGRIWVANQDDATLTLLDGETFGIVRTIALPRASRPYGVCFDPAGRNAYVTLEALGAVLKLDPAAGTVLGRLPIFPTPRGIAVAPDGKTLWVTRFISPADRGEVAQVTADPFALQRIIALDHDENQDTESNGRGVPNAISSLTISPDGLRAWVPFKKDNVRRGMRLSGGGGPDPQGPQPPTFESTVRTGISQIDLATGKEVIGARIDLDNRSMACAVAFNRNGAFAFVATETSNEIAVINAAENVRATAIEPLETGHELGPVGLAVSENDSLLYIHDFMSREIAVYGISEVGGSNLMPRLALISTVEQERLAPEVLRGKQVFYNAADPRMARHKYLSCAVCHLDGGSDGRVWDFTHKGEGLRRTTSLLGKAGLGQGPLHWSANFDEVQDFEHDMRDAFQGTGFMRDADFNQGTRNRSLGDRKTGISPDLDDLAAYVTSLARSRPSPYRNADGSFTDAAREGEGIFNRAETGCAVCHAPPFYTDSRLPPAGAEGHPGAGKIQGYAGIPGAFRTGEGFLLHDVGTAKPGSGLRLGDSLPGFDTPTLKGLWETAAYLHDGSAPTLMDVITTANPGDAHGKTSRLSALERDQLVAFLMQLEDASDATGLRDPAVRNASALGARFSIMKSGDGLRLTLSGSALAAMKQPPVLEIRSPAGGLIRRLDPWRRYAAGLTVWTATWNGRDRNGQPTAPGMYLVQARDAGRKEAMAATSLTWIP